ncbi:MAG: peptide ABC transporter substrate-binding protein [Bdellovibrionales bacterium]|nr:peptide ABC transporter substrate-binding protein [Bdellovibrionales bacterium]MBT3526883.1 peptide ABC transporter substrate-binding protein [Bdellovibrionales bacterium]MBT7668706.1 peptide ABC transporter substrate-binding protein [Bdellovibrionales bacterium]MBT7765746.1 peptide ABC transporter substrate-binding protein [Bdellovibrionales bacterium]
MINLRLSACFLLSLLLLGNLSSFAAKKPLKTVGRPDAPQNGVFLFNLQSGPTTLNPLTSTDFYASQVQSYIVEGLLERNIDTYEFEPALATDWKISKDGLKYDFTLRPGVKWHDGKPLTAEDVKFSFDAIFDPQFKTAHMRPYYENIKEVKILSKNKIRFIAKRKYFKNFSVCATISVLPKHIYMNPSKKQMKKLNKTLIGTGPYILDKYIRGKKLVLKKNPNWWGNKAPHLKGVHNYKKYLMKFVKDETISIEMLKKGNLDYIGLGAEAFIKKTGGSVWGKRVHKIKVENSSVKGYGFIGWNLTNPLFKSKKTRLALYKLVNRQLMIDKFLFKLSEPAIGPLYRTSDYAPKDVKPVMYDPKGALRLLKKDGWEDSDGDQILDKVIDGKRVKFSFTILEPLQDFIKYLTIFKEDAQKMGIEVKIKFVEWNTFIKLLDERKFEAVRLAWGGGSIDWDPKQIWHSSSIKGGSNFIGYSNPKVDKLIDQARSTMDREKRKKMLYQVFKMIADDVPYVFFFNRKFSLYAHTKRMERVKDTYKYGVGTPYWWISK